MERAGAEDMPEDAERQGLGTPATRASILEKLVQMGFVERKGKQLLPTKDGHNLACVLPNVHRNFSGSLVSVVVGVHRLHAGIFK